MAPSPLPPNGSLDTSFSGDGKQTTSFGGQDAANDVAIQVDGKIVVAGATSGPSGVMSFAVARYDPNGSLEVTFSADGKQVTGFGGGDGAHGVGLQANGRIIAAGSGFGSSQTSDFALVGYLGGN